MTDSKLVFLCACLDAIDQPIALLSDEPKLIFGNRELFHLLGAQNPSEYQIRLADFWPAVTENFSYGDVLTEFVTCKDDRFPVQLSIVAIPDQYSLLRVISGSPAVVGTQGLHLQRIETLGILAGGIAHDINNILTGILGHASYLLAVLPTTGAHVESLQAIEDGAKRSAQMTRQIVNFAKAEEIDTVDQVDLTKLVESACNLLRGAISREYKLSYEVPRRAVIVSGVEGQLSQVLINLVINARDALFPNGEIKVNLREVSCEEDSKVAEVIGSERGRYASLCVVDNGAGIPSELIDKIFEPYFSTKKSKGTGLGLATVKKIIASHGGAIKVYSKVGVGTKLFVYLPLASSISQPEARGKTQQDLPRGSEKILVIDDEDAVRNVLALGLERLGYTVELASSGTQGIQKFRLSTFNLVILDMVMPDMSGRDVFFELVKISPNLRVLVCSAYSSDDAVQAILSHPHSAFIQKPFSVEDLAHVVRDCLDKS